LPCWRLLLPQRKEKSDGLDLYPQNPHCRLTQISIHSITMLPPLFWQKLSWRTCWQMSLLPPLLIFDTNERWLPLPWQTSASS
jgi:hypothetical protein